ncbi:hypothetical protein HY085_03780 [Candidatus Gottesmanbacteria bacterium]|nr:hypothetical protein [Candidatus Gottesmanbacteria bacterium]
MSEKIENLGKPEKKEWEECLYHGPKACSGINGLAQKEFKTIKRPFGPWRRRLDFIRQGVDRVRGRCYAVERLRESGKFDLLPCRELQQKIKRRLERKKRGC